MKIQQNDRHSANALPVWKTTVPVVLKTRENTDYASEYLPYNAMISESYLFLSKHSNPYKTFTKALALSKVLQSTERSGVKSASAISVVMVVIISNDQLANIENHHRHKQHQ